MAKKIYTSENYFYIEDTVSGELIEAHRKNVLIKKKNVNSSDYYFRGIPGYNESKSINITEMVDESDVAFTDETFKAFYELNTGFKTATGGSVADPIHEIQGLIMDLNTETMLTTGDVLATEGQVITNWKNAISGNGISGAVQADGTRQPIMQTINGNKEVKFDGSNDFLDLGVPTELDFQNDDDFTIIVQLGSVAGEGAFLHKGQSSLRQYGMFFFPNWNPYLFNTQYPSGQYPLSSANQVIVMRFNGTTNNFVTKINDSQVFSVTNTATGYTNLSTLLGARQNNSSGTSWAFFYGGALRRILAWNRDLTDEELTNIYNELNQ